MANTSSQVNIADLEGGAGEAIELSPQDKVRRSIASWLLIGLFALVLLSAWMLVCIPDSRISHAADFFAWVKAFVPPIVTLIIGFYFRTSSENQ